MPTPIATFPTQSSVLGSLPPVATSVSVPPVLTTVSVPPVMTFVSAPPVVTISLAVNTSGCPVATVTAAPAALIVAVKQPQLTKPYTGQTSW